MDKVIPANYDRKSACFFADDLNNDNKTEIYIGALDMTRFFDKEFNATFSSASKAYMVVVKPTDESGNYEKIADITLSDDGNFVTSTWGQKEKILLGIWESNDLCNKNNFIDIDKDGKKEIIETVTVGADYVAYGIFKVDWKLGKIDWLKIKNPDGSLENTYATNDAFELRDLNSDGVMEFIVGKMVYKWDGSIYNYDKELSTYWDSIDKLRVVSPNGGEQLKIGITYTIEIYEPANFGPEVNFSLFKEDGTRLGNLEGSRPTELKFEWTVGKYTYLEGNEWKTAIAPAGNYYIGLQIPGGPNPVDLSDKPFSIYP